MSGDTELREQVRQRYASSALAVSDGCCGPASTDITGDQYSMTELSSLPADAAAASLGCGNPTAVAELRAGETVLDLGSGGGIDVILSARRVGPTGFAYGLDMTDEMLDLARRNATDAGIDNVEFLRGFIEQIPLRDASVDVVISNCVINLSTDKPAVFAEIFRVLRPGGRIGITDALSVGEYTAGLAEAGFVDVSLTPTHEAADGLSSMIIRAAKPDRPGRRT
jgi:arsenite methyltransferase